MLSEYQLRIADLYNILSETLKYQCLTCLIKRLGLKLKKIHCILEFNQSQWLKSYIEFSTQKRIEAEKNNDKDGKTLYKLMSNAIYRKTI